MSLSLMFMCSTFIYYINHERQKRKDPNHWQHVSQHIISMISSTSTSSLKLLPICDASAYTDVCVVTALPSKRKLYNNAKHPMWYVSIDNYPMWQVEYIT